MDRQWLKSNQSGSSGNGLYIRADLRGLITIFETSGFCDYFWETVRAA
jgi:hypothetical protein